LLSVVRQALLQNQTPEIQAKLLAMQKRIAVSKGGETLAQQQQQVCIDNTGFGG
jgi:hypothetical protein